MAWTNATPSGGYVVGDTAVHTATFTDSEDAALDPGVVTFTVTNPAGTATDYTHGTDNEVANPSVGTFTLTLDVDKEGIWLIVASGTDNSVVDVERAYIRVDPKD